LPDLLVAREDANPQREEFHTWLAHPVAGNQTKIRPDADDEASLDVRLAGSCLNARAIGADEAVHGHIQGPSTDTLAGDHQLVIRHLGDGRGRTGQDERKRKHRTEANAIHDVTSVLSTFLSFVRERLAGPAISTMMMDTITDTSVYARTPPK
jgi:hypothetical protein